MVDNRGTWSLVHNCFHRQTESEGGKNLGMGKGEWVDKEGGLVLKGR